MGAKLVIRVHPNDRIEVKVEGVVEPQAAASPPQAQKRKKRCEKLTRQLESDLGEVCQRIYDDEDAQDTSVLHDRIDETQQQSLHG